MRPRSVLHVDPERGWSGGETQVLALARELSREGVDGRIAGDPAGELLARAFVRRSRACRSAPRAREPLEQHGRVRRKKVGNI